MTHSANNGETASGAHDGCRPATHVSLASIAALFLRIGATGFGGMMPLLSMVHHSVLERRRLVTEEQFTEAVAVGQILPGPIVVDTVTHIGYTLRGIAGAFVATASLILPPALLVTLLSPLYFAHKDSPLLWAALRGVEGVAIGLVVVATWKLARPAVKNWLTAAIAVASFLTLALTRVHPVVVVLAAGAVGMIALRPGTRPEQPPGSGGQEDEQQ